MPTRRRHMWRPTAAIAAAPAASGGRSLAEAVQLLPRSAPAGLIRVGKELSAVTDAIAAGRSVEVARVLRVEPAALGRGLWRERVYAGERPLPGRACAGRRQ